jgi:hypothetical protein
MAQANQYIFPYKELATLLVKAQDIHEGYWGIYVEFRFAASNLGVGEGKLVPATVTMVEAIGLQKFEELNTLSVDAAEVNPRK